MNLVTHEGANEYKFDYVLKLETNGKWLQSPAFNIIDIPGTEFNISAQIAEDYKDINVQIQKSNLKPAMAIIKVQVKKMKPMIYSVVDWRKNIDFHNFSFSLDPNLCRKYILFPLHSNMIKSYYEVRIYCSIIWQGYLEDAYHLDVCNHMKNYYDNTDFSDMKISVGGSEFPVHKNILAKQSPVFYKLLTSDMKESKENVISFPDDDVSSVKEMLLFFYEKKLDEATRNEEMALKLFKFAAMYQIDRLKTACEYILVKNLKIIFMLWERIVIQLFCNNMQLFFSRIMSLICLTQPSKMRLMTKEGKNIYTFTHKFKLPIYCASMNSSLTLDIEDIPDCEFKISAKIADDYMNIYVQVQKSDLRPAVAIIKIQMENHKSKIIRVIDWRKNVDFNNFILSWAFNTCNKNQKKPAECLASHHTFEMTISCSIIWHGYVEDLYHPDVCQHIGNYWDNTVFSNVKIKVGDSEFPAHKIILAEQSLVFNEMLISDLKGSREDIIFFPDADVDVIKEMIRFFYQNRLDKAINDEKMMLKLLKFAIRYQIDKLKAACEYILIRDLKIDNVFNLHAVGIDYNLSILQQHAIAFLENNSSKPLIHPVVDWTQNVDFNHILICVTPDWQKDISYKCEFSYSRLYRSIPVHCSITWQGYIEDTYYLDMCTHIKNYYKNTEFSNMKIKVGDCEFPAHKNLLAKHSPVFHKILISDMKESIENIISFPDADVSTVKEMLLFFYEKKLDEATKNEEMTLKLLKFAAMYEISRLKTACEYILIKSLRIDNIFILYAVGKYYNSTILQQHALIFLKNNASDLLEGACEMFE
ncbi:Similar to SPOPL: Speckle-type POZ protein-like (Homo sapiens) [Cotesia congregata]|uniref:Similar to SPOPL: Speckle-type POZ protein-like (Homo sapiens) n=1 Tax=Cotesia congregata TaxID=51543 RepID=A0A8J2H005_COTCN|nr:Similar to SPOPL: Speckle-type POZ protein-like (Homo sapiens) [Cotesia congregata]